LTEWPESFPPACPPEDAVAAKGEFFRLVDDVPPVSDDFKSNLELRRLGVRFKGQRWSDDCIAAGLSVTQEFEDLKRLRESVGPMRKKKIAVGRVDGSGVMKATPSLSQASHYTWWRRVGDESWKTFRIVA